MLPKVDRTRSWNGIAAQTRKFPGGGGVSRPDVDSEGPRVNEPTLDRGPSSGGGRRIPLADLQAQGFNTTPPPGFAPGGLIRPDYRGFGISAADVFQKLTDLPTINVKTWLPGDDEAGS